MKLKALQSAVALILLAAPVGVTQAAASDDGSLIVQEQVLPQVRSKNLNDQDRAETLSAADIAKAAEEQISAALEAKIHAIIAFMREDAHNASDGTKMLRSRVRVRCSVRHITAKPKPSLTAAPAVLLRQAAGQPKTASATLEACTIKLLQIRRSEVPEPSKQEFSIELPPIEQTTP